MFEILMDEISRSIPASEYVSINPLSPVTHNQNRFEDVWYIKPGEKFPEPDLCASVKLICRFLLDLASFENKFKRLNLDFRMKLSQRIMQALLCL